MLDPCEISALVNTAATLISKDRCIEEIEVFATAFDMLSDNLFAIALLQRKQREICRKRKRCCNREERDLEEDFFEEED